VRLIRRNLIAALAAACVLVPARRAGAHGNHAEDGASGATARAAAAPTRLYIANDDHCDYMWSGADTSYTRVFQQMLGFYMTQIETTAYRAPDLRGRFNADGTLWLWDFMRNQPPAQKARLIDHIRDGSITVPVNFCVQLYGAMPAEAVLRSFAYAGHLARQYQLTFPLIVPMENQTLPGGVASLWAGSGVKYSWKGICNCATAIDAGDRPRSVYRFTGPDGQSVLMKWNAFYGSQKMGGYAESRDPYDAVSLMTTNPTFLTQWPYPVAGAFGYGWDDLESYTTQFIRAAADLSNANQRVIVSNEVDFFRDFEAAHGDSLASFSGAFGNEWDLLTASLAGPTGRFKRGVEKLRSAEALATIAALHDASFLDGRDAARDSAMIACGLYYEHNFGPGPAVDADARIAWQKAIERTFTRYVDALYEDGRAFLAANIQQPAGVERHVVFNPLSWARTDFADLAASIPAPRRVIDLATGLETPSQSVTVDGQARLRVLASNVPSMGYRVYEVRSGAGASFPATSAGAGATLDNGPYAVTLGSRGQITSLIDRKDANRQLVAGGGALNDPGFGASTGGVTIESNGPVSATLRFSASGALSRDTRLTLYAGIDRIDIDNVVHENFTNDQLFSSAFDLPGMTMRHEEVGMIARVGRQAGGGDYADANTRTDYLTFNHFVDLSQAARGVTVSGRDAPFFQSGNSTPLQLDATTPTIRAALGFSPADVGSVLPGQGGETEFPSSFALRTHGAYDAAAAMRMALEHQNPLVSAPVTGGGGSPLPQATWSLLTIDDPGVLAWAVKPAEEGLSSGIVLRAWNLSDQSKPVAVAMPSFPIVGAHTITHIETEIGTATVSNGTLIDNIGRQQMKSWRLYPQGYLAAPPESDPSRPQLDCHPNPLRARQAGVIACTLPAGGRARITVHDVRGARVATLLDGQRPAGRWQVPWNGVGDHGARVAPGVYFVHLATPAGGATRRLVVLD